MNICEGQNINYEWEVSEDKAIDGISYHVYIYDISLEEYIINGKEFQNKNTAIDFLNSYLGK